MRKVGYAEGRITVYISNAYQYLHMSLENGSEGYSIQVHASFIESLCQEGTPWSQFLVDLLRYKVYTISSLIYLYNGSPGGLIVSIYH